MIKKGGDIDLLIYNNNESALTMDAKVYFLAEMIVKIEKLLGEPVSKTGKSRVFDKVSPILTFIVLF